MKPPLSAYPASPIVITGTLIPADDGSEVVQVILSADWVSILHSASPKKTEDTPVAESRVPLIVTLVPTPPLKKISQ